MSAASFSPGPWKVNPLSQHDIVTENGTHVCSTMFSHEIAATDTANGFLLAAAPDLLAALEVAVGLIEAIDGRDNSCNPREDISQLRAAIAKATGETA